MKEIELYNYEDVEGFVEDEVCRESMKKRKSVPDTLKKIETVTGQILQYLGILRVQRKKISFDYDLADPALINLLHGIEKVRFV